MNPLREGDRVYFISKPSRTGVVKNLANGNAYVELDTPEILSSGVACTFLETTIALWRKL